MKTTSLMLAGIAALGSMVTSLSSGEPEAAGAAAIHGPAYSSDGRLQMPTDYRQWVYLSTGFDMSYSPRQEVGHHMFDNVFVEPGAYQIFTNTGSWPDKTVMVLESRGALDEGSINKGGNFQSTEVMGVEVHVKDTQRFAGGWGFFAFEDEKQANMIPVTASCYSCHAAHAAVDTTFVQFYPTLLPIATARGTLSAGYQHDISAAHQP